MRSRKCHATERPKEPVCRFCAARDREDLVQPSPGLGSVHRRCFIQQDLAEEALEIEFGTYGLTPMA